MGGFVKWSEGMQAQAEVASFKAGTDLVLWPTLKYMDELERAIRAGEVPMARLEDALERIRAMKERLGLFRPGGTAPCPMSGRERKAVKLTAQRVAEKSVTLVRDRRRALPLVRSRVRSVLLNMICSRDSIAKELYGLRDILQARGIRVKVDRDVDFKKYRRYAKRYDLILTVHSLTPHQPMGPLNFNNLDSWRSWGVLAGGPEKSVVVGLGTPYLAVDDFEMVDLCLNTYSHCPASQAAVIKALFGEITLKGRAPVKLEYIPKFTL
jgi:beta-N-acetylhexosaminidase